jgi:hypothetical protein
MPEVGETEIQMIRRQILAEEEMVLRQREIVGRLPRSGEIAEIGRAYLAELEDSLAGHRAALARLQDLSSVPPIHTTEQPRPRPAI